MRKLFLAFCIAQCALGILPAVARDNVDHSIRDASSRQFAVSLGGEIGPQFVPKS